MTRRLRALAASAAAALLAAAAAAQGPEEALALVVPSGGAAPSVDGRIGEEEWGGAATFEAKRGGDLFCRGRARRVGRQLYLACEIPASPWALGLRFAFTDPVSGRSNLVLVTPVDPPRPPITLYRQLAGRDASRVSASDCDIRFDFARAEGFALELRIPLDLIEIAPTEKEYAFSFEIWELVEKRAIAVWPQDARAATVQSIAAPLRSGGAWGAEDADGPAPAGSDGLKLLEDAQAPSEDGPALLASTGWIGGKRKDAVLEGFERRAARVSASCPDLLSVHSILVQARLARNDLAGALEALDAWDASLPGIAGTPSQILFRMQLLRDLGRYGEALDLLERRSKELEGDAAAAREKVVLEGLREAWRLEQEMRKAEALRDDLPRVLLETSKGEVVIELFEDDAPNGVANFLALVESRFYDGTRFHWAEGGGRVVGGDPNSRDDDPHNDGFGGPGYLIESEPGRRSVFPLTVTYADNRRERRTEGSAFAIHLVSAPAEDGVNTVLGRVISGEDVVRKLEHYDAVTKATVVRKRPHPYTPTKR